jgi:hypothetical protein
MMIIVKIKIVINNKLNIKKEDDLLFIHCLYFIYVQ